MTENPKSIFHCYYPVLVTLLCLVLYACHPDKKVDTIQSQPLDTNAILLTRQQLSLMDIKLASVVQKIIYPQIFATGIVAATPNLDAEVTSGIGGTINEIYVQEGAMVKKNQALMSLRSTELIQLQQDYMTAMNDLNLYEKEFNRQSALKNANIGALSEFEITESKYLNSKTIEKSLREKLFIQGIDYRDLKDVRVANIIPEKVIRSPINGSIYSMSARLGMRAEQNSILAQIIDLKQLKGLIYCYEKDLSLVKIGQPVNIHFVNESFPFVIGTIQSISGRKDSETKAIVIHTTFKVPAGYTILPGMSLTATIKGTGSGKLSNTIPQTAILDAGSNQKYVYYTSASDTAKKLIFYKVKVETKISDGENIEISFLNKIPNNALVAIKNIDSIENEFKKLDK